MPDGSGPAFCVRFSSGRLRLEHHDGEWWQRQSHRIRPAMSPQGGCIHAAEIAYTTTAIDRCVTVENFLPSPVPRHPDPVVSPDNRGEVAHNKHNITIVRLAQKGDHASFDVAAFYPLK